MFLRLTFIALPVMLVFAGNFPAWAGTTILVNFGPYASVQEAATSEEKVNWRDDDPTDDTVCTECFAAVELQHYIRQATGKADDFVVLDDEAPPPEGDLILVGGPASNAASRRPDWKTSLGVSEKQLTDLGPQGYRIQTATIGGRRVTLLAGGGRVGTLYAVYDFLHRLGCRWFAPGEANEDIPQIGEIPAFDAVEKPDFADRGFHATADRGTTDFFLWMARNRLNFWCVEQSNHPFLWKLGMKLECGSHEIPARFIGPNLPYPYAHRNFPANPSHKGDSPIFAARKSGQSPDAQKMGQSAKPADPYPVSPEFYGDLNHDGQLSYFEAHPEWYALVNGRRTAGIKGFGGCNYCTSNPQATAEFMKNILQALIDGPYRDADVIRFWMLDNGKWCECDACRALGTPTDRNILLVDRLAQEIKKARGEGRIHREIAIHFLAYSDVIAPPSRPLPEDFDYCLAMATFYPIRRCYVHCFDDPACPINAKFVRQLAGWGSAADRYYRGGLCLGEYYNVSRFRNLPLCLMHVMAHDIPYYQQKGVRNFEYMHVTTADWGNKALTNYQMARQTWDAKTDCPALWEDYFRRRYGPAAWTMREFYLGLEKMLCNVNEIKYDFAPRLNHGEKNLFPDAHLRYRREPGVACTGPTLLEMADQAKRCRKLIEEAGRLEVPPRIAARIAEDERTFTYGERTIDYYVACVEALQLARGGQKEAARERQREAVRLAELLRRDTRSQEFGYEHRVPNAFEATMAPRALEYLQKLLGPIQPAK